MSLSPEQLQKIMEATVLLPDDPHRLAFVATLPSLDQESRDCWLALARESDVLRAAIHNVSVPPDLHEKLLALPDLAPVVQPPAKNRWAAISVPWPAAAAVLLIVLAAGGYAVWNNDRPAPLASLPVPPRSTIDSIAGLAAADYLHPLPLDVESDQPEAVRKALQSKLDESASGGKLPFAVAVPAPGAAYHLVGGSIRSLGAATAVETRWKNGVNTYALFQFAPAAFGLPKMFLKQRESVPAGGSGAASSHVAVWPGEQGGVCTWAVATSESGGNEAFSAAAY